MPLTWFLSRRYDQKNVNFRKFQFSRKLEEKRQDDNEDVLKSRLKVYLNETKPLLDFYQKENKLNKINGMQTINDVNNQINDFILSLKNT